MADIYMYVHICVQIYLCKIFLKNCLVEDVAAGCDNWVEAGEVRVHQVGVVGGVGRVGGGGKREDREAVAGSTISLTRQVDAGQGGWRGER